MGAFRGRPPHGRFYDVLGLTEKRRAGPQVAIAALMLVVRWRNNRPKRMGR